LNRMTGDRIMLLATTAAATILLLLLLRGDGAVRLALVDKHKLKCLRKKAIRSMHRLESDFVV
jgi:hypothetical protein